MLKRYLLCLPCVLILGSSVPELSWAQSSDPATVGVERPADYGSQPGDYGYRHVEFHPVYQQVFKDCPCGLGECRVTSVRPDSDSETGLDVIVDRSWVKVTKDMLVTKVTAGQATKLAEAPAHVCAYTAVPNCVYVGTMT